MSVEDAIRVLTEEVQGVKKILVGNGDIGLCEQVRDNKKDIEDVRAEHERELREIHEDIKSSKNPPFRLKEWMIVLGFLLTGGGTVAGFWKETLIKLLTGGN